MRTVEVYLTIYTMRKRSTGALQYRAEWRSRKHGTLMYKSKLCPETEEPIKLARKWLEKVNSKPPRRGELAREIHYVDTTKLGELLLTDAWREYE